jgi:hypothetical protein
MLTLVLVGSSTVLAQRIRSTANVLHGGEISAAEWKMLPEYCIDTQGFKYGRGESPNTAKWLAQLGQTFWTLHHYCLGVIKFNRGQRLEFPEVMRHGFLTGALGEFRFVTNKMPERYVLAPEILTYVGRTHLLLNQPKDAAEAFIAAQRVKPDYWPAYSWLATYLADHGEQKEARRIAMQGLSHAPNSRTLQLIVQDLDRKQSYSGDVRAMRPQN